MMSNSFTKVYQNHVEFLLKQTVPGLTNPSNHIKSCNLIDNPTQPGIQ